MRYFILTLCLIVAALGYVNATHPKVFKDVWADLQQPPADTSLSGSSVPATQVSPPSSEVASVAPKLPDSGASAVPPSGSVTATVGSSEPPPVTSIAPTTTSPSTSVQANVSVATTATPIPAVSEATAPTPSAPPAPLPTLPDTLTTLDGKTYENVKLVQLDPDAITIMHKDGGGLIPLKNCPPDIQKLCQYDPAKAAAAETKRAADEEQNRQLLAAESQAQAQQLAATNQAQAQAQDSQKPTMTEEEKAYLICKRQGLLNRIADLEADKKEAFQGVAYAGSTVLINDGHRQKRANEDTTQIQQLQQELASLPTVQ